MSQPVLDTLAEVRKLKQAGCPEEQAEAMVDLVSRAPLNTRIARALEQVQFRLESIEAAMAGMATKSALEALRIATKSDLEALSMATKSDLEALSMATKSDLEALSMATKSDLEALSMATKSDLEALSMATKSDLEVLRIATKSDLEVLRAETKAGFAGLRAEMSRMFWIQGGVLGTLILGLASIMVGLSL